MRAASGKAQRYGLTLLFVTAVTGFLAVVLLILEVRTGAVALLVPGASLIAAWIGNAMVGAAVARSERKYWLMFDSNPDPMFIIDAGTLEILSVNRAATAAYGYSQAELVGMRSVDLVYPGDIVLSMANQRNLPPVGTVDVFRPAVWRTRAKDGATVYVDVLASRLAIEGRQCAIVVARNVTDTMRTTAALRDAEEYWRALLEASTDCFLLIDASDRVAFASRSLADAPADTLRNRSIHEIVVAEDVPGLGARFDAVRKEGLAAALEVHVGAGDEVVPYEGRCIPVNLEHDGTMLLLVLTDTRERRAQERRLNEAKERAESANQAKDRVIAGLSHDLRTPLTPILAAVSLIRARCPEGADLADVIERSVESEARLLDELLDPDRLAERVLAPSTTGVTPMHILLVEDDEDTRETLSEALRASHYDVETADSEATALRAFEASDFDLVISDVGLPDGSGLELLPKLAKIHPVRAIALSGYGTADDVSRSKDAGFARHLTKPITLDKLLAAVHDVAHANGQA
jgi:PAS domain S-box-containing protein